MATQGMDSVCASVSNLQDALAFYRDIVGMKVVADETLEPDQIQQLWNLPRGTEARAVFLKIETCSTLVEAIEFRPHSERAIKQGAEALYYGLHDIAFRVSGMDEIYRYLVTKGFAFLTPPILYQPVFVPFAVKQIFFLGPGNIPITLIERMTGQEQESQGYFTGLVDSAQIVENLDEAFKFYVDILGLDITNEATVPEGLLEELLGLPPNTNLKLAFINRKDTDALPAEILKLSVKGKSPAVVARPPNLGLFMISFEVDNLSSLIKRLEKERISVLSGPVELRTQLHGKMKTVAVEGPSGSLIGLFER